MGLIKFPPQIPLLLWTGLVECVRRSGLALATITVLLTGFALCRALHDPYRLRQYPTVNRSRLYSLFRKSSKLESTFGTLTYYVDLGYEKYSKKGKPFRLWSNVFHDYVYILPAEDLDVVMRESSNSLSLLDVTSQWHHTHKYAPELVDGTRSNLATMMAFSNSELVAHMDFTEWRSFLASELSTKLTIRLTTRIFCGAVLSRDVNFLRLFQDFHYKLTNAVGFLNNYYLTTPIRSLFAAVILWPIRSSLVGATKPLISLIKRRSHDQAVWPLSQHEKPKDVLQSALDYKPPRYKHSISRLAQIILNTSVSSVTPMVSTLTMMMFCIVEYPEYLGHMRQEITARLGEYGGWTAGALRDMVLLDSFLQEALRMVPECSLTMWRKVKNKPFKFPDGRIFPVGTILATAALNVHMDPANYETPQAFDGYRFYNLKQNDPEKEVTYKASTNPSPGLPLVRSRQTSLPRKIPSSQ
ncbi:MAG: hypothetical protein M1814_002208 [Vezdaea aestivalis]|nr:MAG: hypothetical protein M1814_002208 [Vezdaea aestivalis]